MELARAKLGGEDNRVSRALVKRSHRTISSLFQPYDGSITNVCCPTFAANAVIVNTKFRVLTALLSKYLPAKHLPGKSNLCC